MKVQHFFSITTVATLILFYGCKPTEENPDPSPVGKPKTALELFKEDFNKNYKANYFIQSDLIWNGDASQCKEGTLQQTQVNKALAVLNYVRRLAGLNDNVVFNSVKNAKCQKMALMLYANIPITVNPHSPPSSWKCYTAEGAEAAPKSNLTGGPAISDSPIMGFIEDPGDNNKEAGHRRSFLNPRAEEMGFGAVSKPNGSAAAVWVKDNESFPNKMKKDFIAWPPEGYVASEMVFPRWSFDIPDADFTSTQVMLTYPNGNSVNQTLTIVDAFMENGVVWEPGNFDPKTVSDSAIFKVQVNNVVVGGSPKNFSYNVKVVNPY